MDKECLKKRRSNQTVNYETVNCKKTVKNLGNSYSNVIVIVIFETELMVVVVVVVLLFFQIIVIII
jgi:hypothetical protein